MTATPIPRDETCTVPGCELPPQFSRGYCTMHRQRLRFGRPMCPERLCAPHWTQAELDVLHENLGRLGFDGVARRLGRTRTAVLLKSRRLGLRIQGVDGRYTPNALGKLTSGSAANTSRPTSANSPSASA